MTMLEIARTYVAAGLSVIPVLLDGTKKPAARLLPEEPDESGGKVHATWKPFQQRRPNDQELVHWFEGGKAGIAVVCGEVSGGLEVLDFDDPEIFERWYAALKDQRPDLVPRLPVVRTPRGGSHVYYRTRNRAGNRKLARATAGGVAIETRAEGGYVLAPGSPGYKRIAGPPLTKIPTLDEL